MSVRWDGAVIRLEGDCHVETAETLVGLLAERPQGPVDLSLCRHLHTAVLQVLLSLRPVVTGPIADEVLHDWALAPLLEPAA